MSDITIPWGDTPEDNQRAIENVARDLHNKVADGDRTRSEMKEQVERMAADLRKASQELAKVKEANVAARTREVNGSTGELRQFIQRDATQGSESVQLWTRKVKFAGQDVGEMPGLLDTHDNHSEWHVRAKELAEGVHFAAALRNAGRGPVRDVETLRRAAGRELAALGAHLARGPGVIGRLAAEQVARAFTDSANVGGEFIPDQIVLPQLDRALAISDYGLVTDNLAVMEMSGKNLRMPFAETLPRPHKYGTNTIDDPANFTGSTPGTSDRTIVPVGVAVSVAMDRDALDDMVFDFVPELRSQIARAIMLSREDCSINGDTAATHQDDASGNLATWNPNSLFAGTGGGSGDHRKLWNGWRAKAFDIGATAKLDTGTGLTYDEVLALAAKLGDTQHIPGQDLALVCSYADYIEHILAIDEVKTLDKYGPQASVLSGEVATVGPFRVLKSPVLTQEFEASGLYTNGSGGFGTMVGVNLSRWQIARRRGLRVEMATEIRNGMVYLVATIREVLRDRDASTLRNAVVAINI